MPVVRSWSGSWRCSPGLGCTSRWASSPTRGLTSFLGIRPRPPFGHGVEVDAPDGRTVLGSYHVSQQNTFTGKLTPEMLDGVLHRARELAGEPPTG